MKHAFAFTGRFSTFRHRIVSKINIISATVFPDRLHKSHHEGKSGYHNREECGDVDPDEESGFISRERADNTLLEEYVSLLNKIVNGKD